MNTNIKKKKKQNAHTQEGRGKGFYATAAILYD